LPHHDIKMSAFTRNHVVKLFLLSVYISRGSSFQPLLKVQHHDAVSKSLHYAAELSHHYDGRRQYHHQQLSSSSALQMGFVEDFLSGADASQREVENNKYIAELQQRISRINSLEATIEELGDDELEQKTMEFKNRVQQKGESINGPLLEEAFAVVREAAWYVYDNQFFSMLKRDSNNA
jgi:SecA DEAD-like domain